MSQKILPEPHQSGATTAPQIGLIAVLIIVLAAGILLLTGIWQTNDHSESTPAPEPDTQPEVAPATEIEQPADSEPAPEPLLASKPEPIPAPLPELLESDDAVRNALADIPLGTAGQKYLLPNNIIERSTSVIYLMAKGEVPYKLIPIARPKVAFPISDDGLQVTADPEGHARYNALVAWIQSLDTESLLSAIDWLLPLFTETWSFYGESESSFDQAVLYTLDLIIYTPEVDTSGARLFRKEAVWLYEDPALEGLAPIQKQLLRMGPANAAIIKAQAREAQSWWSAYLATDG